MNILITSQKQLDELPTINKCRLIINFGTLESPALLNKRYSNDWVYIIKNSYVKVETEQYLMIYAKDNANVVSNKSCLIWATDNAKVQAHGTTSVLALKQAKINAYDEVFVKGYSNCLNVSVFAKTVKVNGNLGLLTMGYQGV